MAPERLRRVASFRSLFSLAIWSPVVPTGLTDAMSCDSPADLLRKSVGFAVCQAWDTLFLQYSRYVSWRRARPDFRLRAVDLRRRRP